MENEVIDHAAGPASDPEQTPSTEGKLETPTDESILSDPTIDALLKKYPSIPLDAFRSIPPLPIPWPTDNPPLPIQTICGGPNDSIKPPETGVAGPEWAYLMQPDKGINLRFGRGIPNYIPEWELIQEGENWYHVDDVNRSHPVIFPGPKLNDEVVRYIPYSFVPRTLVSTLYMVDEIDYREPLDLEQLQTSLGSLYSVPSDNRFNNRNETIRYTPFEVLSFII
ncbi:hypothetical protein FQN50_005114 [Emmonsiellopsis sp. PD_5]|nr:hypothetical protein FQN50_005114 [Emmonsiellopsis sp. PD_5]